MLPQIITEDIGQHEENDEKVFTNIQNLLELTMEVMKVLWKWRILPLLLAQK